MSATDGFEGRFIRYLTGLADEREQSDRPGQGRAALAALRRGAGKRPGATPEMYPYVVPQLPPGATKERENAFYLVAALFALHPRHRSGDEPWRSNLGASFAELARRRDQASIDRRFVAMLACHPDDLAEHLRHAIGLLEVEDIAVDWYRLLVDVQRWGHPDRFVQRNWARSFWGAPEPDED